MNNNSSIDNFDPETHVLNKYERFVRSVYVFLNMDGPFILMSSLLYGMTFLSFVFILISLFDHKWLFSLPFSLLFFISMLFFYREGSRLKKNKPTLAELRKIKEEEDAEAAKNLKRHNESLDFYSGVIDVLLKHKLITQQQFKDIDYIYTIDNDYAIVFHTGNKIPDKIHFFSVTTILAHELKLKKEEVES